MYYPLLRGRQNELLALKELLSESLLSKHITPIIEPVKLSPTIVSTLEAFNISNREIILIRNPKVGAFKTDAQNTKNAEYYEKLKRVIGKDTPILRGLRVDKNTPQQAEQWRAKNIPGGSVVSICLKPDNIKYFEMAYRDDLDVRIVVPYSSAFRRVGSNRILMEDGFNKKERNADYADEPDEFFSSNHLDYASDHFVGFSDYSIIGEEYTESGFAPYAVAIHIVYFDEDMNLRIHHFTSSSNEDKSDPAGKFYQALQDLVEWNKTRKLKTKGIREFEKIYEAQTYPGLGVVKKLSIMHHIELMGRYLDGTENDLL